MKLRCLLLLIALSLSVWGASAIVEPLAARDYDVSGGCYYEVMVKAQIRDVDKTNLQAVATCYFTYSSCGRRVRADGGLITGFVPADPYTGYEYLFSDRATFVGNVGTWIFQVMAPSCADRLHLEITGWKNLSAVEVNNVAFRRMRRLPVTVLNSLSSDSFQPWRFLYRQRWTILRKKCYLCEKQRRNEFAKGNLDRLASGNSLFPCHAHSQYRAFLPRG